MYYQDNTIIIHTLFKVNRNRHEKYCLSGEPESELSELVQKIRSIYLLLHTSFVFEQAHNTFAGRTVASGVGRQPSEALFFVRKGDTKGCKG